MLFNSLEFLLFLPTIFILYWFVFKNKLKAQNILLLIASYVFYGWWDWRFLSLIIISTAIDYFVGLQLHKTAEISKRKWLLAISLSANLGMLGFFKYFNFFVQSWVDAWAKVGVNIEGSTLNIILPVGISFYTFQTLSYTIDIYRKQLEPAKSFIDFAAFVTFFPQLVAGPIERASHLLPQFYTKRKFDYDFATSGVKLIIWGLFKKIVVADSCAFFINPIFENPEAYSSGELIVALILFSFQIYGDFSGYSDIAIGVSRLFGFDLMINFKFPFFSRDIAEFWRRWHISLTTWFRDYLYIPLGGSKGTKALQLRNVMIIFLVSGFWHGANWTYILWGILHGVLFLPLLLRNSNRNNLATKSYSYVDAMKICITFLLICSTWILFRADSIDLSLRYLIQLIQFDSLSLQFFIKNNAFTLMFLVSTLSIVFLCSRELTWILQKREEPNLNRYWAFFFLIAIFLMGSFKNQMDFIYFQF